MGTGIVSVLLNTLPYNGQWLYWISVAIFALNVLLFATGCIITLLRYTLYPEIFFAMIRHPVQSMFIGTFPMGFATIINMFCFVCVPAWGEWSRNFAWGLWIFDAVFSVITAFSLPFLLMAHGSETQLSSMTAVWLLPIVSCIVAASSGAIVADVLPNPQHALWTVIVSYILWGIGLPLALMVMVIYLQRLTLHKLPPKAVIVSVFLPLGPLGQGGFGIMKLGSAAQTIFPQTQTLTLDSGFGSGPVFYTVGFMVGLILWSFGLVWLFLAIASIARCRSFPFNIGWWGFTFPLGVFATSTCQLGKELPSEFFRVLGTVCFFIPSFFLRVRIGRSGCEGMLIFWVGIDSLPLCGGVVGSGGRGHVARGAVGPVVLCALFG
ncbi:TDT family transporter [Aspergillus brunneoviolaceus CBS 621.78]|uniref:C4-dicarboxylate transporter/malic acid transport protein n=1 Tax=Aspergillus brunneoviolaceus CBS 621.78 TaxID=1450534 RepID=A0ACD1GJH5_9EURO|nr:putative C4-dicarboxylate transporter/malic acid transport protein [Aspergillus brunneoviolaceus CBS 621.78]RAH49434.1 putative C4-dicarboxylate transporter/malic acid transport protein [Aspergillus brunneoviolaceus CBS 621.78]